MTMDYIGFETEMDMGQVLSGKPSGRNIMAWTQPSATYTPEIDKFYLFPSWAQDLVVWLRLKDPLYLYGPTGCGKTSCLKQLVAKFNWPVFEATGHNRLEFPALVGQHVLAEGNQMVFEYGPLAKAMKYGGLFLLNEIDLLAPDTLAGLNSVLDGSPLLIPENGGEVIKPHPRFRFAATANSNGTGDDTGLYQGIMRMNTAAMDRFVFCKADYIDTKYEKRVVMKQCQSLPEVAIDTILKFAEAVRKLFKGESAHGIDNPVDLPFSTRSVLKTARLCTEYAPLQARGIDVMWYALERAVVMRASTGTIVTLKEVYQRITGRDPDNPVESDAQQTSGN